MINHDYSVSIKQNTNLIYCSTIASNAFKVLQPGALIKIGDDKVFYEIASKEDKYLIKSFKHQNGTLFVEEDFGLDIGLGDDVEISFKEYELLGIFEILDGGKNYKLNEVIQVTDGLAQLDIVSGSEKYSKLKVTGVNSAGGIESLEVTTKGLYIESPAEILNINGIYGAGAQIRVKYLPTVSRKTLNRKIVGINFSNGVTAIHLDSPINRHIKEGKFSLEKTVLGLNTNYTNSDKTNSPFELVKDFTRSYALPLMAPNTIAREAIYNKSMNKIDEALSRIEERLAILERS